MPRALIPRAPAASGSSAEASAPSPTIVRVIVRWRRTTTATTTTMSNRSLGRTIPPNRRIVSLEITVGTERGLSPKITFARSEEHTSELQSRFDLVCRLLLEKKKEEHTIRH